MRQSAVEHAFFFLLLAAVSLAFLAVIWGFLVPVFWASVLAIIFHPLHQRLVKDFRGRGSLAAVLTLVSILVVVVLPLVLLGSALTRQAQSLYERLQEGDVDVTGLAERVRPMAADYLGRYGIDVGGIEQSISQAAVTASQWFASSALEFGQDALRVTALFVLMLYILFFFLRDGRTIVDGLVRALPLGDVRERRLFAKFAEVTRATLKSTLVIAAVQGSLGGLLFWAAGIRAPVFWGFLMAVLSLLPAVGAALVWLPGGLVLIATGSWVRGLVVIAFGAAVISSMDNFLRPILVGRGTRIPDYLVLLSTLGGLAVFGLSGFVVGPVVASLFLAVWEMFAEEYSLPNERLRSRGASVSPEVDPDSI